MFSHEEVSMTFIHEKAEVSDGVRLGKNCWVSAFAAINANEGAVVIGDACSIQESCVIHGTNVRIGSNVTIGHGAIVHGATIGNNVVVGMHATVVDGAVIGDDVIIGAQALVTSGARIPSRSLVLGSPGKVVRQLGEKDIQFISASCENYLRKLGEKGLLES